MASKNILDQREFDKQIEYLKFCIGENETGANKFLVLNNEAGFSKSIVADNAAVLNHNKKFLLVKKYNDEQFKSKERMEELLRIDSWGWGAIPNTTFLVVNSDNAYLYENEWGYTQELQHSDVVIISHEKYRLLSNSDKLYLYTKDRDVLIIDEYLDVPIIRVNKQYFNEYGVLFPERDLGRDTYNAIQDFFIDLLNSKIELVKNSNMALIELGKTDKNNAKMLLSRLEELKVLFNLKSPDFLRSRANLKYKDLPITNLTYFKFFLEIESVIRNQCIYSSYDKSLSTYRPFSFWTLKNNIILDASGGFLKEYALNQKFDLKPQGKVFNYAETTIHCKAFNSLKSRIESKFSENPTDSTRKYLTVLSDYIKSNQKLGDKTLVVNYKSHYEGFSELWDIGGVENAWHGNVLGKNDWRDFNKLFINSTYNMPEAGYILIYSFFKGKRITKNDLKTHAQGGTRRFRNGEIEDIKQNHILHHLYQTIKRINRDVDQKSDIFIVTDNEHFLANIAELMENVVVKWDYHLVLPETYKSPKRVEKDKELEAVESELKRLLSIDKNKRNEFLKKKFCQVVGWDTNKLREKFNSVQINKLCKEYGVDFNRTFKNRSVKYIYFKGQ
jgi:hypothetical protein